MNDYNRVYERLAKTNTIQRRNMKKHIICIFGASGSGKDTAAEHLAAHHPFLMRKFARPMKEFVEKCYNLKPGTLDTHEVKAQKLFEGSEHTFSDLLVGAYHFWQQFDDAMTARNVMRDIKELTLQTPWNVVLTDVRKSCEAFLLRDLLEEHSDVRLHILCIGGRGTELSSDTQQKECIDILKQECYSIRYINNKFDLNFLQKQLDSFALSELVYT